MSFISDSPLSAEGAALRDDAPQTHLARVLEDVGTVADQVFVEVNPFPGIAQYFCELHLALLERSQSPVFAVKFEEIEGVEHHRLVVSLAMQLVEIRYAVLVADHGFAIDDGRLSLEPAHRLNDPAKSVCPVCAPPREQANSLSLSPDDQPVAVMLDLVNPVGSNRHAD